MFILLQCVSKGLRGPYGVHLNWGYPVVLVMLIATCFRPQLFQEQRRLFHLQANSAGIGTLLVCVATLGLEAWGRSPQVTPHVARTTGSKTQQ